MRYWIIAICLMFGCTTANLSSTYSDDLQKWIGYPENELFDALGLPDRLFYVAQNEKIAVYVSIYDKPINMPYKGQIYYSGINENNHWWNRIFGAPKLKQMEPYYCKTSFVIRNGIVTNFNLNGDNC